MKKVLIIGVGEFGKHIAKRLTDLKDDICIVDSDREKIDQLVNVYDNLYVGDCMQVETLKQLGVKEFDVCIVAIGENFQASLEITSRLKECGAKYIISKAATEIQEKFLKMAGADETVYPEMDVADKVAARAHTNNLLDFTTITDSVGIYEIHVFKEWIGKNLIELNIRKKYKINVIAVKSYKKVFMPDPEYIFHEEDNIYILGERAVVEKFMNAYK